MCTVIIDTDPGVDDALALMMAMNSPDLVVEGITTVGGNATLSDTTDNALRLVEHLQGKQSVMPVAVGADRPLRGSFTHAYHVHGSGGLGVRLPAPTLRPYGMSAADFMCDRAAASAGPLTVIALGPLTNVAAALDTCPELVGALAEIVVMGGAFDVPGNVTPHAEFNIYEDPWAANAVFASGVPATVVGLDVTRQTSMHRRAGPRWFEGASRSAVLGNRILADRFRERDDFQEFYLHDPLAVAAAIDPDVLTCRPAQVTVVTDGEERGRTLATYGEGTARVAVEVDVERAVELVRSLISDNRA
ncbi:MAG: nucleoside hydrolase [Chloroflexota bacterium]|nr:nucleoside hydrolase [Chloroflexota bacterium]MDE2884406.1 nucleoside hydrolase [Chloroflexota bacterium]